MTLSIFKPIKFFFPSSTHHQKYSHYIKGWKKKEKRKSTEKISGRTKNGTERVNSFQDDARYAYQEIAQKDYFRG